MARWRWSVVDDHSRYAVGLVACADQKRVTVRVQLTGLFECEGLPRTMLSNNGLTVLEVWLMRLDAQVYHSRPFRTHAQGADEQFHRTIGVEVLQDRSFASGAALHAAFDPWRKVYSHQWPYVPVGDLPPGTRY